MDNTQQAKAVPLVEQLRSVPADARLSIDTPNALGCMDTRHFAVGRMCHEAAAALSLPVEAASESVREQAVAWRISRDKKVYGIDLRESSGEFYAGTQATADEYQAKGWTVTPLYASPLPAVQTVRMTDEEIAEIAERMEATDPTDGFWREFARAIEQAVHQAHQKEGA